MTETSLTARKYRTESEAETFALGEALGTQIHAGDVILLSGGLGAGKTVLVKGLARGLGIDPDDVHSPSFTLVNFYPAPIPLYHIDLYRLQNGVESAYAVDLDEILQREDAIVVIEWAERLGNFPLPARPWRIEIQGDGDQPRQIRVVRPEPANGSPNA